jgi:hypothetical protein
MRSGIGAYFSTPASAGFLCSTLEVLGGRLLPRTAFYSKNLSFV